MQAMNKRVLLITLIVLVAAISRLIPHPLNFAPLGAMALFGAAYFGSRGLGLLITLCSWLASDLLLNNLVYPSGEGFVFFTEGAFYIYGSITLIYLLGTQVLKKVTATRMLIGSLSASLIFFLVSNFGVWMMGQYYPMNFTGLAECYVAALPFLKNTIAGDFFYSALLFFLFERFMRSQLAPKKARVQ